MTNTALDIDWSGRVIHACDVDTYELAEKRLRLLQGHVRWVKIGATLYMAAPQTLELALELGYKVFIDMKWKDVPRQVKGACRAAARRGVSMMTVHADGGRAMLEAAVRGAKEGAAEAGLPEPMVLAITVLTSLDLNDLREIGVKVEVGFEDRAISDQVVNLAALAEECGVHAVVCSPQETSMLFLSTERLKLINPGVRSPGADHDDQKRVGTHKQAIADGADYLVVGSEIAKAKDPVVVIQTIAEQMTQGADERRDKRGVEC